MAAPGTFAAKGDASKKVGIASSSQIKKAADNFLKKHATKYQLKKNLSDLKYVTTIRTKAASYVRYQETINNHPVFTKQVTVTVSPQGKAKLVVSDYTPYNEVVAIKSKLSAKAVQSKALQRIGAKEKDQSAPATQNYGYTIQDGKAIPVVRVVSHTSKPYGAWETYVHAENGKVLTKKNLNQEATGTGKVFQPNPLESYGATSSFSDNRDRDSTALNNQLKTVSLLGLNGTGYLKGSYVTISSKANTYSSTNTFNYTRAKNSFEDVMVYYHIDTMQRYIQSLGFNNINNRSITANVNTISDDNSYYDPSNKKLTFGSGGVDDAEDAGIITHEYGHSIQDNQVPGFGNSSQGGAMGEGFGDFLGATYEDATSSSSYGKACVGEWDATSYSSSNPPCLRRLDNNKVYPADWEGEVHADGEIWSQALYDMASTFGRDTATKIVLQSHWSLTPNASFSDGYKGMLAADASLYGSAHKDKITAIFAARGIK
ncbi:M36 family metallopeptidase [Marininema halotolerans]|nr:M36 family metallopeptidase [Marininema halotolerans]